ncbi:MAG: tyrosine-type recombinase/integrase [Treponema sp.]|jgi:site-specific recombinase XerD|nr:tyrosine-type recombinase/integrase [Treponema sp.]
MEIAYIFCEPGIIRVPLFGYDKRLYRFFLARGGKWDKAHNEFILDENRSAEQLCGDSPGVPFVLIKGQSPVSVRVFGFLGRPWEQTALDNQQRTKYPVPVQPSVLPDQFPKHWEIKLENELRSRKYSRSTILAYIYYNRLLCRSLQKPPERIQSDDIKQFLAAIEKDRDYSAASLNLAISAMKFFYKRVLQKDIIREQRRPHHDRRLPIVLSKDEIRKMLMTRKNFKHRLLLMMVYASGLRVSEVVRLKRQDIDIARKLIMVKSGKGRKDRYVIMSETVIKVLADYYSRYNITDWLFSGAAPNKHLAARSAQHIFEDALKESKIVKDASIHSLRHSFATHLLESGTDIRYIQELLGHSSIRTTERYTHVARRKFLAITSPLDTIDDEE